LQSRIKGLIKSYLKNKGLNKWAGILNSLLDNFKADAYLQELKTNILEILNYIIENFNEGLNKTTKETVILTYKKLFSLFYSH